MRYVIVDPDGSSREYLESFRAVVVALADARDEDIDYAAELIVVAYDDEGNRVGEPIDASRVPYVYPAEGDGGNITRSSPAVERSLAAASA